jgi:hypothetical protein
MKKRAAEKAGTAALGKFRKHSMAHMSGVTKWRGQEFFVELITYHQTTRPNEVGAVRAQQENVMHSSKDDMAIIDKVYQESGQLMKRLFTDRLSAAQRPDRATTDILVTGEPPLAVSPVPADSSLTVL